MAERNGGPWVLAAVVVVVVAGLGLRVGYALEAREYQPPDSQAYARIAENLYQEGSFDARAREDRREVQATSAYSPGLPFLVAGVHWLTGGIHLTAARVVLAMFGAVAVLLAYLLGRRLHGPVAGLAAAGGLAVYPAMLEYHGLLLTEALAASLLAGGLLLFLRAIDGAGLWTWAGAGGLLGALALVRPEYLPVAGLLPLVGLIWGSRDAGLRRRSLAVGAMLLGAALVLAPWVVRNMVVLDRFVPVSTGGGKALYIGTNLDADGDGVKLRDVLLDQRPLLRERLERTGPLDDPNRLVLERVLARVAADEDPGADTDVALWRLGRENLGDDLAQHPGEFASMLASKAYRMWTEPARGVMAKGPWPALHLGLPIAAALALLVLLARRRVEGLVLSLILLYATGVGALLIASPRRELVVLPLVSALAGAGLAWLAAQARRPPESRRVTLGRLEPRSEHGR
jgi:Dolichyl-phosphate-mannose-protein mannosyltransferase